MKTKNTKISNSSATSLENAGGWDEYWSKHKHRVLYDIIAEFYRKILIRPSLNHFIKKHLKKNDLVLHAGCGSGQVDADIRHYISIIALDISPNALKIYEQENKGLCKTLLGNIFSIPLSSETVDGIYNLGVMEHFTEEEISVILAEFKRVLKPHGKLVVFWPPEFGLSVLFFKALTFAVEVLTHKKVKFHPDEVCRIRSKKHAYNIFERAGLQVIDYYFGLRDFFTYSVVVVSKAECND